MPDDESRPPPVTTAPAELHGCVTLWLALAIVAGAISVLIYPLMPVVAIREVAPEYESWMAVPYVLGAVLHIVCLLAIFRFRMWGFVGMWVVGLAAVALNLYAGMKLPQAVSGLVGLVILYWLLQIGGEKSGWSRLR